MSFPCCLWLTDNIYVMHKFYAILCILLWPKENLPILCSKSVHHRCCWEGEHLWMEAGQLSGLPSFCMVFWNLGLWQRAWSKVRSDTNFTFSLPWGGCLCSGLPGLGEAWWGSVNLLVSPFLFLCFTLHLETLALVKVFFFMASCSSWYFWGLGGERGWALEIPMLPFCSHHPCTIDFWENVGSTRSWYSHRGFQDRGGAWTKPWRIIKTIKRREKTFWTWDQHEEQSGSWKEDEVFLRKTID